MGLRRLTAVMVGLGLLGSPMVALWCSEDSPAAKACCQREASTCNQPGKTDDCCHGTSHDQDQGALPAAKADVKAKVASLHAILCTPAAVTWTVGLTAFVTAGVISPLPQTSPPRSSVLRI